MVRRARRDGLSVAVMSKVSGFSVGLTTLVSAFCRFHARTSADGLSVAVMSKVSGFSVGLTTLVSAFCRFHARASAAVPGKREDRALVTTAHRRDRSRPQRHKSGQQRRYRRFVAARTMRNCAVAMTMSKVSGFSVGLTTLVSAFCRFHARTSAAVPGKTERIVTTAHRRDRSRPQRHKSGQQRRYRRFVAARTMRNCAVATTM